PAGGAVRPGGDERAAAGGTLRPRLAGRGHPGKAAPRPALAGRTERPPPAEGAEVREGPAGGRTPRVGGGSVVRAPEADAGRGALPAGRPGLPGHRRRVAAEVELPAVGVRPGPQEGGAGRHPVPRVAAL